MPGSFVTRFAFILCVFFTLAGCAGRETEPERIRFSILYTSDTHGHVATSEDTIGLDRIAGVKKALEPCLLLDSGDFSDGTPMAVLDKGESMVRLMMRAGYFAAAVGNHEFTYGRAALAERIAQADAGPGTMTILSANITAPDGSLLAPASTRTVIEGVSICVFGLTTPETKTQAAPSAVAGLDFPDPLTASRDTARELRNSGCEIVIALAHIGNDTRIPLKSTTIAEATPGLDIMLDGHAHMELEHRTPSGALVVSPGALGKKLGRLDVEYDREQRKILSIANTLLTPESVSRFAPDAALTEEIAALVRKTEAALAGQAGEALYYLDGSRSAVRSRETNLGNLVADSLRAAHHSDFALCNGGSIRGSVSKGPVTAKDILTVLPFTGNVVTFQVTGAELKAILEHGLRSLPGEEGGFPQVSGMIVHIQGNAPHGHRVKALFLSTGNPVDMEKTYTLTVNSFLAEGGDGYAMLAGKARYKTYTSPQESLINYLQLAGTGKYAPGEATRLIFLP